MDIVESFLCEKFDEALRLAKEYQKIGTLDECREAKEKQIPKEPLICGISKQGLNGDTIHTNAVSYQDDCYECPSCESFLGYVTDCGDEKYQDNFCPACGQALKWGD